jgi:phosphatidylglycerophosphatase A
MLARQIALAFGAGLAPKAPGTAGSLVGLALGALLLHLSPIALAAGTLAATLAGLWAIRACLGPTTSQDPNWIVIDEVAGQMLALVALPRPSPLGLLAAFALFRLFDIAKPGPIGWADKKSGPVAIMADDLLAGAATAFMLLLAQAVLETPI